MKDRNNRCHSRIAALALSAGLALSAAGPAAAASLEADFNGDGYDDLAVGVPEEEVGVLNGAGAVNVFYGSAAGLTDVGNQLWEGFDTFDGFGTTLAGGDFDGDGYTDLAIGVPNATVSSISWVGSVTVLYGSAGGLTDVGSQEWHEDSTDVKGVAEQFDFFAQALAAGDFDGDGYADLAIGVPLESFGTKTNAGQVHVLYGSAAGLMAVGNQLWHQNKKGIKGAARSYDQFGASLVAGDFNRDGRDDLAIGVPFDYVAVQIDPTTKVKMPIGAVNVLYGSGSGLRADGNQYWHQEKSGIAGKPNLGEQFGFALAAGDFDNNGAEDLAVGVPLDEVGAAGNAGAVNVIYGSASGLRASGDQLWHQNKKGVNEKAENGDAFGHSLAAGDFDNDGKDDLAVGVPAETVGLVGTAGAVNVLYGTGTGLKAASDQLWHQDKAGVSDAAEPDDAFGKRVFAGDFDGDGYADLVIGVPGEDIDAIVDAGIVNLLPGSVDGLSSLNEQVWHQDQTGILDLAEDGDAFGLALP